MTARRVVITGMGAVTPLGNDVSSTWKSLIEGRSGISKISCFDASKFPSQIAGEVKDYDFSPWLKKSQALKDAKKNTQFALGACQEAMEDSGLDTSAMDRRRLGLYYAAGESGAMLQPLVRANHQAFDGNCKFHVEKYVRERLSTMAVSEEIEKEPFSTLRHLIETFDVRGPA